MAELPVRITADLSQFERDVAEAQKKGNKGAKDAAKGATSAWAGAGKAVLGAFGGLVSFELGKKIAKEFLTASFQAEAFAKELKGIQGLDITTGTTAQIAELNDTLTAGIDIGKAFVVEVVGAIAPSLMEAGKTALAFGLAGLDAFKVWAEGKDVLHEVAEYIAGGFFDAVTAPIRWLDDLAASFGLDQLASQLEGAANAAERFAAEQTDLIADFYAGGGALNALGIDVDSYRARIDKLTDSVGKNRQEHEKLTAAVVDNAQVEIRYAQTVADIKVDAIEAVAPVAQMSGDQQVDIALNTASALSDIIQSVFGENKAAQYASAIINTAVAVAGALANPPYPPYSIPQAIAAGAAGGAQVAAIASTNIAHSGLGFNPASAGQMAPDEMPWKLRKNEGVLTERGVNAVGGYAQVRRLNAGQAPGMGGRFVGITKFQHKAFDATLGANLARPAAARTEIKAIAQTGGRVGHRIRSST